MNPTPEDIRMLTHEELVKLPWTHFTRNPFMPGEDVRYLERVLAQAAGDIYRTPVLGDRLKEAPPVLDVLEWGAGGSTVFFNRLLMQHCPTEWRWLAIEHDATWAKIVEENLPIHHAHVVLCDTKGKDPREDRDLDMTYYVEYPQRMGMRFDLVIIDGRCRRRCLLEAQALLKPYGICLLHDAERSYYHCAMDSFGDRQMMVPGTRWWRGWLQ